MRSARSSRRWPSARERAGVAATLARSGHRFRQDDRAQRRPVGARVALRARSRRNHDAGVLIGTSRKRFLGDFAAVPLDVDQRLEGSIATEAWALLQGVSMVRVHDAAAAVQLRELLVRPVEEVVA